MAYRSINYAVKWQIPVKTWKGDRLELFDLSKDVSEERDLSKTHPDKTQELHQLMVDFLSGVGAEARKTGSKSETYKRAK